LNGRVWFVEFKAGYAPAPTLSTTAGLRGISAKMMLRDCGNLRLE